ncbi:hypothetical protein [Aliarcobacter thereius]|uniref:Lipoprotein n=1 Tax=Aliarcobacter thereius LMG 24486 TaxID=1032240 RepID=A0A1C7WMB7_9BACT|nr:hypothetical protein [Aliarcobacter thereius]OCL91992.1 hypothetical protein AAX25_00717 [Aliarcobacter thereius]OCL94910.1 hypothetical protein AA347_00356 [Aliarcobacter thereius LMG 24486]QBF15218.1 hypothetical protein ATH_0121 [Aliarcobacter thereius LMG 24486]TLS91957.1 hypothetical protein FE244_07460 [Aliarcobacter thereius]
MLRLLIISLFALLFISCTTKSNLMQDEFTVSKKQNTYDTCANFSFISLSNDEEYGKIFTEYINLDSSCKWNGLARGYFVALFMDTIKANSYKLIEQKEFKNLEVLTYIVDEKYYVNIINSYSVFEDKLMIDYNGIYSTFLIQNYEKDYVNIYLDKDRLNKKYFNSLVKFNFFKSYFSKESSNFDK